MSDEKTAVAVAPETKADAAKSAEKLELPAGCTNIEGNLFRVPTDLIRYADGVLDFKSKELQIINPRYANTVGKVRPAGLNQHEINELREEIRSEGLNNPLRVRPMKDKDGTFYFQLLAGERRLRCINTLRKEKSKAFNPVSGKTEPAEKVYETVRVLIVNVTDPVAYYKVAFKDNDTGVKIGEGAEAALVRYWRHHNLSDQQILQMTGKSTTWLAETDKLCNLDEKTFAAFAKGELSRSGAIKLSAIPDADVRLDRLERARQVIEEELKASVAKVDKELAAAEEDREIAEAGEALAEANGGDVATAKAKTAAAAAKVGKKKTLKEKLTTKTKKIGGKVVNRVLTESGEAEVKPLSRAKIEKMGEQIKAVIKAKGIDAESGKPIEGYDESTMRAFDVLVNSFILKGDGDPIKACRQHAKKQAKRDN
jgi:hypothetical protein